MAFSSRLSLIQLVTFFIAGLLTSAVLAAVVLLAEGKSIGSIAESGDLSGDESETNIENPVLTRAFTLQQEVAELKAQVSVESLVAEEMQ